MDTAAAYPDFAENSQLLADVACVALNRLQPRYIRHQVDLSFYTDDHDRAQLEIAVQEAVVFAFHFVQIRRPQDKS